VKVTRVSFVGTRTSQFDATVSLFRDVLGLQPAFANTDWAGFHLPSGPRDMLEVMGPGMTDERVAPAAFEGGALVAFGVADVVGARQEMADAGIELLGDIVWAVELTGDPADTDWGWFYFRAPDGTVFVIQQSGSGAA
jgi:catechol 2,3-dioxygenase-like lactoylglutathione lyase family enzyme